MKIDILKMPNFKKVAKSIQIPKAVMENVMLDLRSDMMKRLDKGKDQNGRAFVKYATSTKVYKAGLGKSNTVNLEDTGKMRRGVQRGQIKVNYGELVINDHKEVGYKHQSGNGVKKREWFGADKKSEKKAILRIRKYVEKQAGNI